MGRYFGIHFDGQNAFVQSVEAEFFVEAVDEMERNDTKLIVLREKEATNLVKEILKIKTGERSGDLLIPLDG